VEVVKLNKDELLNKLVAIMNNKQWQIISQLRGQPIPDTNTKKKNLLGRLFHKTISIRARKSNARDLQQYVCQKISDHTGFPWGKDCMIASREMGQGGTDIRLIGEALQKFPFSVECKSEKTWNLQTAIKQAVANRIEGTNWLLFLERKSRIIEDRSPIVVVLEAEVFFNLIK
jgi:hypothetical protein